MFHRPRSGLNLHPVMPAMSEPESVPSPAAGSPDPAPVAHLSATSNNQPQPATEEEAEPMSAYNNQAAPEAQQNDQPVAVQNAPASGYVPQQRPAMPAMGQRSPYAYNQSSYMGTTETAVSTGRKLVIGEGITMSGEIEACDHLVVEGTVEASLKGATILDVSQSGMFFGAVEINEATIAGRFEGDLVVNGRLTVRATGTITGTIAYKELAVEAGATIDGKITPMSNARMTTTEKKPQTSSHPNQQGKKAHAGDAGGELFTPNKAVAAA